MPKLFSRMDELSWLTPSISDILDQGVVPLSGNGSIREQMLLLQEKLVELKTPARVINVRPTPSYTLFIAKPDSIDNEGQRQTIASYEIKRSIAHIAKSNKDWKVGFIPQLQEFPDAVGILLQTNAHKRLSLRRMVVRSAYKNHPSTLAFVAGNTLEQKILVKDLAEVGNLLFTGSDMTKQHFINSLLLTLLTLNTPSELRLAIAGQGNEAFNLFIQAPHALGQLLPQPNDAIRLLKGLITEMNKRKMWLQEQGVSTIEGYNKILINQGKTQIPRILLVIDTLSNTDWQEATGNWVEAIYTLLKDRGKTGIHLILTVDTLTSNHIPGEFLPEFEVNIVTRTAAGNITDKIKNFHGSLMQFVDAFVIEPDNHVIPIELCTISRAEIEKAIAFWKFVAEQRKRETQKTLISGKTGVTGTLSPRDNNTQFDSSQSTDHEEVEVDNTRVDQAQALAAYLGWIGIGPLQDVLLMTPEEAQNTIQKLRKDGIIEGGTSKTPRFVHLGPSPK